MAFPIYEKLVKTNAMRVVLTLVIGHHERGRKTALQMTIEIHEMWIHVVEDCALRREPKGDSQSPAEGLNKATAGMRLPKRSQMGQLPPFAPAHFSGGRNPSDPF